MSTRWSIERGRDERGIILPLTLIILVVLVTMVSAMLALGTTEPQIAANLVRGAQALSIAEAGAERAIAAFNADSTCIISAQNPDYPTPPTGCSTGTVTLYSSSAVGVSNMGTYTVTYTPISYATILVESTGTTTTGIRRVVRVVITRQWYSDYGILANQVQVTGNASVAGNAGAVHGNGSVTLSGSEFIIQTGTSAGSTCTGCTDPARVGDPGDSGPNKPSVPIPTDVPPDYIKRATIILGGNASSIDSAYASQYVALPSGCSGGGCTFAPAIPATSGCSSPLTAVTPAQGSTPATSQSVTYIPEKFILNTTAITVGGTTIAACSLTYQDTSLFNGWTMSNSVSGDWTLAGGGITPPDGAYYAPVGIRTSNNTNPGSVPSPWKATFIAGTSSDTGQIEIAGAGTFQAYYNDLAMLAGNIKVTGGPSLTGTVFATSRSAPPSGFNGNVSIAGNVSLVGNVVAFNQAYVTGSGGGVGNEAKIVYNVSGRTRMLSPAISLVSWNAISTLD